MALKFQLRVIVLLSLAIFWIAVDKAAFAHEPYTEWRIPGTSASCCNDNDCRPTRARMDDNEQWEAWDGERWLKVPRDRVLGFPSPDGRSHICEAHGNVYCFVPGETKG